jgi:hypothetical protein
MNKIQNKLRDLSTRQLKYILLQLHAKKNIKQINNLNKSTIIQLLLEPLMVTYTYKMKRLLSGNGTQSAAKQPKYNPKIIEYLTEKYPSILTTLKNCLQIDDSQLLFLKKNLNMLDSIDIVRKNQRETIYRSLVKNISDFKIPLITINYNRQSNIDNILYINTNSIIQTSLNRIYTDCVYNKKKCVAKCIKFNGQEYNKAAIYIEMIINIFMNIIFNSNSYLPVSVPALLKIGHSYDLPYDIVVIQEFVDGIEIWESNTLEQDIMKLCTGLDFVYKEYNFIHGDMHYHNVFCGNDGKIYLIDFGYSCFSVEWSPNSIQSLYTDVNFFGYSEQSRKCINKSFDICTLILSLNQYDPSNLSKLSNKIRKKYIDALNKQLTENSVMHGIFSTYRNPLTIDDAIKKVFDILKYKNINNKLGKKYRLEFNYESQKFEGDNFDYKYLYLMISIDIGMTPSQVIKELQLPYAYV